jgi:ELWxxDGT repeat protein
MDRLRAEAVSEAGQRELPVIPDDGGAEDARLTPTAGAELWKSDGTASGTVMVKDIHAGATGSQPSQLLDAAGVLYFTADDGTGGVELWKSDGSGAGTVKVKEICPSACGADPQNLFLARADGRLVFSATDGSSGRELYVSDGTAAGTRRFQDIAPGTDSSGPDSFFVVGANLFFVADDAAHAREWTLSLSNL